MSDRKHGIAVVAAGVAEDLRLAPQMARANGFSGVLYDAYSSSLNVPELSGSGRREFRHMLSTHGQSLVGLHVDLGSKGFGPGADIDQVLSRLDRVLDAAAGVQSPLVCLSAGPLPEPPRPKKTATPISPEQAGSIILPNLTAAPAPESTCLHSIPSTVDPNFVSEVDGALADLGRMADRYGVVIAFRSELSSFAAMERAIKAANCQWFGVDMDPVAILRDDWGVDEVFSRLGNLIRHVRARDALRGANHRTQPTPIGQGSTEWLGLLKNLDNASYHGWITVDSLEIADRRGAAKAGLAYLSAVGSKR